MSFAFNDIVLGEGSEMIRVIIEMARSGSKLGNDEYIKMFKVVQKDQGWF